QVGAASRAFAQPPIVIRLVDVPAIDRQAPLLSLLAERVRRNTHLRTEIELRLTRPHVGAVERHDKRKIAEQPHTREIAPRLLPLLPGDPLQVLEEQRPLVELDASAIQRGRLTIAQPVRPLGPGTCVEAFVEGPEQRVLVQPPRLFAPERLELAYARRRSPFGAEELPVAGLERLLLG